MLAVTHTIASAAIGASISNAPIAFGIALVFHYISDVIFHWNIYIDKHRWPYFWIAIDLSSGFIFIYLLNPELFFETPIIAAIIGGNLPDVHAGIIYLFKLNRDKVHLFHERIQKETNNPFKGIISQIILITVSIWLLMR